MKLPNMTLPYWGEKKPANLVFAEWKKQHKPEINPFWFNIIKETKNDGTSC